MKSKVYKGFILKVKYPGCHKNVGDFEPYTTGLYIQFPDIWEPVYHTQYLRDIKINEIIETSE